MTLAVPDTFPRNVEVHVADAVVPLRLHVVNVPPLTPVSESETVPVGVTNDVDVSVTVTVQVDPWLATTGVVQETAVVVGLGFTASVADAVPVPAVLVAFTLTVKDPAFA